MKTDNYIESSGSRGGGILQLFTIELWGCITVTERTRSFVSVLNCPCFNFVLEMSQRARYVFMRMSNLKVLVALLVATSGLMNTPVATAKHFKPRFKVLNFFLHDRLLTPTDPSAFFIIQPLAGTNPDVTSFFGALAVFDDSMTVSPDESSQEIGRGRGFYLQDQNSTSIPAVEFSWTAEFKQASGFTPGSTLTFKGFARILDPVKEIAIVGGTGDFRLARGWAILETYSFEMGNTDINITAYFQYGF